MENIPNNVNDLEPILQRFIRENITLHEDEVKKANQNLKSLLLGKIEEQLRKDETFQTLYKEPQYVGSYYENLRVGHPNEFDINLELELPIKDKSILIDTTGTEPGFTKIKVEKVFKQRTPDAVRKKIESWLDKGYMNRESVMKWLQGIVDKSLTKITWPPDMTVRRTTSGPAVTLHVERNDDKFDVDLVPVFRFNKDEWPSQPIRQADDVPRNIDTSSLKWCVVPKSPRSAPSSNFQWRMSFYMIEKELMRDLNNMKPIIKLFKLLRDKQEWGGLSSYYIKTLFMWEQENQRHVVRFWRKPLSYLFIHMLNVLEECLENGRIKFFWHKDCNLIDHLKPDNVKNMTGRIKFLKKLIYRALEDNRMNLSDEMDTVFTT
ncbi:hypothetical protein L9F63_002467 [Diploptera punctata]|uniref:Uncharacterized protein n=1 Tax=Diploptera punctata TaxID=6984 RepID=A0AAD7ZTA3_DIPPU|nr:hypothetical protein L9F63_002467 [Diploptera punctata]